MNNVLRIITHYFLEPRTFANKLTSALQVRSVKIHSDRARHRAVYDEQTKGFLLQRRDAAFLAARRRLGLEQLQCTFRLRGVARELHGLLPQRCRARSGRGLTHRFERRNVNSV